MSKPVIEAFFDNPTYTISYLVADPETGEAAVIDPVLDYDHKAGTVDTRSCEAILARAERAGLQDRVGARNPRPCRPPVRRALLQGQDRRQDRHRREHHQGADHLPAGVQRHRSEDRRIRFRPSVQGWRDLQDRQSDRRDHPHAGPHAGRHLLQDRRCRLCRRHHLHARLRHGPRRLPRRRRPPALSIDPEAAGAARRDAPVHVPRLQGAGPRRICLGNHRRRGKAERPPQGRRDRGDFVNMRQARDATLAAPGPSAALDPGEHPRRPLPQGRDTTGSITSSCRSRPKTAHEDIIAA